MTGLQTKLLIGLVGVVVLAAAVIGVIKAVDSIYDAGYDAGEQAAQTEQLQALVDAQERIIGLNKELAEKSVAYAKLEAEAMLESTTAPQTVTRIIRENPQFQCVRPAALASERVRSLQAIADAVGPRSDGGVP